MKNTFHLIWFRTGAFLLGANDAVIATKQCFHYIETAISCCDGLSAFFFARSHIRIGNDTHHLFLILYLFSDSVHPIALHRRFEYRWLAKLSVLRVDCFSLFLDCLDGEYRWKICANQQNVRKIRFQFDISWSTVVLCACMYVYAYVSVDSTEGKKVGRSRVQNEFVDLDLKFNFCKRFFIIFIWCTTRSTECEFMNVCVGVCHLGRQRHRLNWVSICVCLVWQKPIFVAVT